MKTVYDCGCAATKRYSTHAIFMLMLFSVEIWKTTRSRAVVHVAKLSSLGAAVALQAILLIEPVNCRIFYDVANLSTTTILPSQVEFVSDILAEWH